MAIGFVGCIGALKENKCLLLTVSVLGPSLWLLVPSASLLGPVQHQGALWGLPGQLGLEGSLKRIHYSWGWGLRLDNHEVQASLGYRVRPYLK